MVFKEINPKRYKLNACSGQSLIEVIVAIGIAAILLGAGVAALAPIIRSNLETRTVQFADSLTQNYVDKLKNLSESNWNSLYGLSKGSGNNYMLVASGTQTLIVQGEEASPDNDVTYGLVGHWKFDETAGTQAYDFSGNGNGGTLVNSPTRTASSSCAVGNCLSFNGTNNHINIPDSDNWYFGTNSFAISFWVYRTGINAWAGPLGQNNNGTGWGFHLGSGGTQLVFVSNASGSWAGDLFDSTTLTADTWIHIVVARDGNTLRLFRNCQEVDSQDATGYNYPNTAFQLLIGRFASTIDDYYFPGRIDDVRVYNRALSVSEVKQLYNNRIYARSFTIENTSRDSCGVGDITTEATSTCASGPATSGVADDPSTQKITVNASWSGGGSAGSAISKILYIARTASTIFRQTDWSGGSGQEGPITSINNQFATSTDVNYSQSGSITIFGY